MNCDIDFNDDSMCPSSISNVLDYNNCVNTVNINYYIIII